MARKNSFDERGLRRAVERHWQYHARGQQIHWSASLNEHGELQFEVGPVFQEMLGGENDGKVLWAGFQFNLSGLLSEPELEVSGVSAMSFCTECSEAPFIGIQGRFRDKPFLLKIRLEPAGEVREIVDTIHQVVRPIEEKQ